MRHTFSHSHVLLGITSKWFNDQASSDFEVRLKNDKVLHCHRLVLRSWSEVWAAALEDKKETSLDLTAHDPAIVEMCVCGIATQLRLMLTQMTLSHMHFVCSPVRPQRPGDCLRASPHPSGHLRAHCLELHGPLSLFARTRVPAPAKQCTAAVTNQGLHVQGVRNCL